MRLVQCPECQNIYDAEGQTACFCYCSGRPIGPGAGIKCLPYAPAPGETEEQALRKSQAERAKRNELKRQSIPAA